MANRNDEMNNTSYLRLCVLVNDHLLISFTFFVALCYGSDASVVAL